MTKCIGLTGGIGSGKSTVADMFKELGADIIDADKISKALLNFGEPAYNDVVLHFHDITLVSGDIDRNKLRQIIMQNVTEKQWLENLLHPLIQNEIRQQIDKTTAPYCIIDIPLLAESKDNYSFLDKIIVVESPLEARIQRVMSRSSLNETEVKQIIDAQASDEERRQIADEVIVNDGSLDDLHKSVVKLDKTLKNQQDSC